MYDERVHARYAGEEAENARSLAPFLFGSVSSGRGDLSLSVFFIAPPMLSGGV